MQVEALYDQGKLDFVTPLHFKRTPLRVVVHVPDDAIIFLDPVRNLPPEIIEGAQAMLARMEAIRKAPLSADDQLRELAAKERERIDAFELRDEIKGMR